MFSAWGWKPLSNSVSFLGCEVLPDEQGLAGGGRRGCNPKQASFGILLLALLAPVTGTGTEQPGVVPVHGLGDKHKGLFFYFLVAETSN